MVLHGQPRARFTRSGGEIVLGRDALAANDFPVHAHRGLQRPGCRRHGRSLRPVVLQEPQPDFVAGSIGPREAERHLARRVNPRLGERHEFGEVGVANGRQSHRSAGDFQSKRWPQLFNGFGHVTNLCIRTMTAWLDGRVLPITRQDSRAAPSFSVTRNRSRTTRVSSSTANSGSSRDARISPLCQTAFGQRHDPASAVRPGERGATRRARCDPASAVRPGVGGLTRWCDHRAHGAQR